MSRESTLVLMSDFPLAPEYDSAEHYLASVGVRRFSLSDEKLSVRDMRDAVNLLVVLQSELHRRFCLTFSADLRLDMAGTEQVWTVCRGLTDRTDNMCRGLETVLTYHECLGLQEESPRPSVSLAVASAGNVSGELRSGVRHVQNCLLKLRQTLQLADSNSHLDQTRDSLVDIIHELNTSREILEEALQSLLMSINPQPNIEKLDIGRIEDKGKSEDEKKKIILNENDEIRHEDEVFEAFIKRENSDDENIDDLFVNEVQTNTKERSHSRKVLTELKTVLVGKQREWKVREDKALARKRGEEYVEDEVDYKLTEKDLRNFRESHLSDSENGDSLEGDTSAAGHQLLTNNKLFRRPRRPAASKHKSVLESGDNVITDREGRPRTVNIQPVGFDSL